MKTINRKAINLREIPLLRVTSISGLILLLLIGVPLIGIFVSGVATRGADQESAFHRLLREYDFKYRQTAEMGSEAVRSQAYERLDSDLDRLEKMAEGVENWLSVLKRRRHLARLDYRYERPYRQTSRRATEAFPYSEPIAAIAAAAVVYDAAINPENERYLRQALPLLATSRIAPIRMSLHVLLGDFNSPETAADRVPRDFSTVLSAETEAVFLDLIILKILARDLPAAAIGIQELLSPESVSMEMVRLAAEYYYDFGDLVRSAQLFSTLPDDISLSRQADALWCAGYYDNARAIWTLQTQEVNVPSGVRVPEGVRLPSGVHINRRALYNLAITAPTPEEEMALLSRLVEQSNHLDSSGRLGIIRLSRFLDAPRAVALLDTDRGSALPPSERQALNVLTDLEILKRRTEIAELARMFAEIWLLLDQHPQEENLYQWGAWFFNLQRNYTENAKLLEIAARHHFTGDWTKVYGALRDIHDGDFNAAEGALLAAASAASGSAASENGAWAVFANLGRILETRHASARALEFYERALAILLASGDQSAERRNTASRIQVRVALCLKSLSRPNDARRSLEYALDLNPDNLTARLELSRL